MKPVSRYLWLAAGLAVVVVFLFWVPIDDDGVVEEPPRSRLPGELQPYADLLAEIEALSASDPQLAEEKSRELLARLPDDKFKQWHELAFHAGIEDIRFYGKVVDQNGNPLPGAKVHYEAAGKFLGQGSGMGSVVSGVDGAFLIEARGGSLTIHNFRHPDAMYAALPEESAGSSRMYTTGNTFWSYTRRVGGNNLIWSDSSAANPIVFDLWVVDRRQAEIHAGNILWDSQFIKLLADGRDYTVFFGSTGRHFSVVGGQNSEGDLVISCRADTMNDPGDRGSWSATLAPVAGGIQPTKDRYLNRAPDTGYRPSVEIGSPIVVDGQAANVFGLRYYFTAQNGDNFGALFVDVEPFNLPFSFKTREYGEQYCRIRIEYKVNRGGSPYLFKNRRLLAEVDGT